MPSSTPIARELALAPKSKVRSCRIRSMDKLCVGNPHLPSSAMAALGARSLLTCEAVLSAACPVQTGWAAPSKWWAAYVEIRRSKQEHVPTIYNETIEIQSGRPRGYEGCPLGRGCSLAARRSLGPRASHVSPLWTLQRLRLGPDVAAAYASRGENCHSGTAHYAFSQAPPRFASHHGASWTWSPQPAAERSTPSKAIGGSWPRWCRPMKCGSASGAAGMPLAALAGRFEFGKYGSAVEAVQALQDHAT